MTNYSKIVRKDDEPDNDDGFEGWRDSLTLEQHNQYCADYIDSYNPALSGYVEQEWIGVNGYKAATIKFDMQGDFQDYLDRVYKTDVLPYSSTPD